VGHTLRRLAEVDLGRRGQVAHPELAAVEDLRHPRLVQIQLIHGSQFPRGRGRAQALARQFGERQYEIGQRRVAHVENVHVEVERLVRQDSAAVQMRRPEDERAGSPLNPLGPSAGAGLRLEHAGVRAVRANVARLGVMAAGDADHLRKMSPNAPRTILPDL